MSFHILAILKKILFQRYVYFAESAIVAGCRHTFTWSEMTAAAMVAYFIHTFAWLRWNDMTFSWNRRVFSFAKFKSGPHNHTLSFNAHSTFSHGFFFKIQSKFSVRLLISSSVENFMHELWQATQPTSIVCILYECSQ